MARILRLALVLGVAFAVAGEIGCGSSATSPGTGGQGGTSSSGGNTAGAGGTSGGSGGATTPVTCIASGSGGAVSAYTNPGVCGDRGQATADATSFSGYEERFVIGDSGLGDDVCVVRFDLKRVGDATTVCKDCSWTHLLEYSNPQVMTDSGGVCAKSDLALTSDAIAKIVGTRIAIGFADQYQGAHGSVRMKYYACSNTWDVDGNATWNKTTKLFSYIFRNGTCNFGP